MTVRPAASPAPPSLGRIARRVDARIDAVLEAEIARWAGLDSALAEPLGCLRDLVRAGGKRLRPAFCHWALVGAGGDPGSAVVLDAECALELLHTFALIHDDVMDGSCTRRGRDTVHIAFADRHTLGGWRGEGRRFGEGVAILVGDLAFVYADRLLAGAPAEAIEVFTELRIEVNVGQFLDLIGTVNGRPGPSQVRRIALYKSGKYTVERPLHMGAALAGRLHDLAGPLSAFGLPLGEAFQLRDDLLGAFGQQDLLGKPVGEDFREGKPTALVAIARQRAGGAAARLLAERLGAPDLTATEVAEVQSVLVETGARAEVEDEVDALVSQALVALDKAPLTPEAAAELRELAGFIAGRGY